MTRIGIISGTGAYDWPGLDEAKSRQADTPYGAVRLTTGKIAKVEVVHVSRHGAGHNRLSNQVNHRANLRALLDAEVDAVIATTVCGAVDPSLELGSLVVFDDLHFLSNRLPDGSICTWHTTPGAPGRGHWIFDGPFSDQLRAVLAKAVTAPGLPFRTSGTYGHVDGPRFNTRTEIAALAAVGVAAVSQTLGPEVVLAGEAELPLAALGYVTDYANGVGNNDEQVGSLTARLREAPHALAEVIAAALPAIDGPDRPGTLLGFD